MTRTPYEGLFDMSASVYHLCLPSCDLEPAPNAARVGELLPRGVVRFIKPQSPTVWHPTPVPALRAFFPEWPALPAWAASGRRRNLHDVQSSGIPVTTYELLDVQGESTLVQITPGRYLPHIIDIDMRIGPANRVADAQADLVHADVTVALDEPHCGITVVRSSLVGRDSRGPQVVHDRTIALALRSLTDHIVHCDQNGWHIDTQLAWRPEPVPAEDRTLKRIKQRMQSNWVERRQLILQAATAFEDAQEHRKPAIRAVSRALHVSERLAVDLIREAKDAGCLADT